MTREQIKDAMFDELYESEMDELGHICEDPKLIEQIADEIPERQLENLTGNFEYFVESEGSEFFRDGEYAVVNVRFMFEKK